MTSVTDIKRSICPIELGSLVVYLSGRCTIITNNRASAVVTACAFHQWGRGSIPGLGVICGLSLLLVLFSAPRGFSLGTPVFPSPHKPNSNSIQIWDHFGEWNFVGKYHDFNALVYSQFSRHREVRINEVRFRVRSFGMIQIRISDPRSLRSWRIKGTEKSLPRVASFDAP